MADSSADRDPLDRLAEEFVARFRAGERPAVDEFVGRLPDRADEIRELFPALVELEQLKPAADDPTGPHAGAAEPPLDRLGEFRILREVGRGGMGVVYEAVQDPLGRHVALKVLPAGSLPDSRRLERFRREARAAARLHHTNIVPVFGTGEAGGQYYYAMQFIRGHGLDAVIDEVRRLRAGEPAAGASPAALGLATGAFSGTVVEGPTATFGPADSTAPHSPAPSPPPDDSPAPAAPSSLSGEGWGYWRGVARVGAQVADALAYAHAQGIVHRDVKPSNLLLDAGGTVWVTDFGLAKGGEDEGLTGTGDFVGTLRYMAPERFENQGDHRADVYALGLTLYELLTLRPAYSADTRAKLIEQVVAANPARPRALAPSIPRDLETVVLKAIARDPAMRYQSATELAADLRRFVEDRPVLARRASSAEQAWRWCRRNKAVASLLAAVLVVFAAGAGVSAYFAVEEGRRANESAANAKEAGDNALLAASREQQAKRESDRANGEAKKAREERDTVRALLHDSYINHAQTALADDRIPRVRRLLLDASPKNGEPDLRGWEWHYLDRQVNPRFHAEIRPTADFPPADVAEDDDLPPPPRRGLRRVYPDTYFDLTPDGRRAVMARPEGDGLVLEVWGVRGGRLIGRVPKTGSLALGEWRPVALSADGRHVAAVGGAPAGKREFGHPRGRVRVWEVETGAEVAAPGPVGPDVSWLQNWLGVGPDAAWVAWCESSPPPPENPPRPGPWKAELVRWDRASGQVTRTTLPQPVWPYGRGGRMDDEVHLTPDGKFLYRVYTYGKLPLNYQEDDPIPAEYALEGWDLTADPPKALWKTFPLAQNCLALTTVFSRGWAAVAACDGREVTVYRLADAKLLWSAPCSRAGELFGVSDDGNRVAFESTYRVTVLENGGHGGPRELVFRWPESEFGRHVHLTGDGSTVLVVPAGRRVQVLDVARDPSLAAGGEGLRLLRPGPGRPESNPCVVRDSTGREVLRVELSPKGGRLAAQLVAGERRLLTNGTRPIVVAFDETGPAPKKDDPNEWVLYDVTRPSGGRVGGGPGNAIPVPGTPWVVVARNAGVVVYRWGPKNSSSMLAVPRATAVLHSALTGEPVHEITPPPGEDRCGGAVPAFDPTGTRYAVVTQPALEPDRDGRPGRAAGPLTLRVREVATGREVWAAEAGDPLTGQSLGEVSVFFDPTGRRVFVAHWAAWLKPGEPTTGKSERPLFHLPEPGRDANRPQPVQEVWVGRAADGAHERTVRLQPDPTDEPRRGGFGIPQMLGVAADGRLLVGVNRRTGGEIQVWNPETGERTHRLVGHDGILAWAAAPAGGSRLFAIAGSEAGARLHVWDLTTSRELLIIPVRLGEPAFRPALPGNQYGVWYDGGKVFVPGPDGLQVFDGSPVKP